MPNWCGNTLILAHDDPAMITRAVEAFDRGEFLNEFIPVPPELQITAGSVSDPVEQALLEEKTRANKEKYGYDNWYDFCIGEWGTKWDVEAYDKVEYDDQHDKNGITFGFDSAWSPPIGVYEELVEQGYSVRAYYYEGGMAYCGKWEDGDDDYYEYDLSDVESIENIPEHIVDYGNLMEEHENWIEDNADEGEEE